MSICVRSASRGANDRVAIRVDVHRRELYYLLGRADRTALLQTAADLSSSSAWELAFLHERVVTAGMPCQAPVREQNSRLIRLYRSAIIESTELQAVPVALAVLERAAQMRVQHLLRTPDAIHAATALEVGCGTMLSNDQRFAGIPGLRLVSPAA